MQLYIGKDVKSFKTVLKTKYGLKDYTSIYKPTLFWGIYGMGDLGVLSAHKGVKIVVINGTDSTHAKIMRTMRPIVKKDNIPVIAGSNWVAEDLGRAGIKFNKIPLLMSNINLWEC